MQMSKLSNDNITAPSLELINAVLVEKNLKEFVVQAWRIIEPETDFVDNWHIDAICEHLEAVSRSEIKRLLINVPPRHAKLLADSTTVPSPLGYKKHGDLKVGDYVFGSHGKPVKIIRVSPKDIADCVVSFRNGQRIKCNRDHLWTVFDKCGREWKTVTTEYLLNSTTEKHNRFSVPILTVIPRKNVKRLNSAKRRVTIDKVYKAKYPEIGNCITVDSPDGLYVVGEKNIVTHNSSIVSVMWPCWQWLSSPGIKSIYATYASSLSIRDSIRCSRIINSSWYKRINLNQLKLLTDTQVKIENNSGGFRIATSVDGAVIGEGADQLVADDVHNIRHIESRTRREAVILWWDEIMSSRLNDVKTGTKVIIMQRSHEEDLAGHVLTKELKYDHLCLPSRYEGENRSRTSLFFVDPRTEEGEILWKAKLPKEELDKLEGELGAYAFAGQYQQSPSPREGGMFHVDMLRQVFVVNKDEIMAAVRYVDKAGTKGGGAYTCCVLMYRMKNNHYVVADVIAGQWGASEREGIIKEVIKKDYSDAKHYRYKYQFWTEQEPASSGKESAQNTIINLAGYPVYADRVTGNKATRAEPFSCQVNIGNVSLLHDGEWVKSYKENLRFYPMGKYKDWGDASAGAFNKLALKTKRAGAWPKKEK